MFKYKYMLFYFAMYLFISCSSPTQSNDSIYGTWENKYDERGGWNQVIGYRIEELTFERDSIFESKSTSYGIYPDQKYEDFSAWTSIIGTFIVNDSRIVFIPEKFIYFDTTYYEMTYPDTSEYKYSPIFDKCSFEIDKNKLTLYYTFYPADAPVDTFKVFNRKEL